MQIQFAKMKETPLSVLYEKTKIDLSSEVPKVRKTCLEELLNVISNPASCEDRDTIFSIFKLVVRRFEDTSESCRELSVRITLSFLESWSVTGDAIFLLLPLIQKRLCVEQPGETSEQIRLLLIELVTIIVNKYPTDISPFAEKIVNIMVLGFGDPSPDVKKNTCTCASVVAKTLADFRLHSDAVISAILPILKHKHYRVRVAAVNALSMFLPAFVDARYFPLNISTFSGDIVMFGRNGCVEQVCGALGEKLLDQNAHVRGAILRTAALWCRKLQDRYSRFHYLLPLMLSG